MDDSCGSYNPLYRLYQGTRYGFESGRGPKGENYKKG